MRGSINMLTIIIAFILAIMNVNIHNACSPAPDSFSTSSRVKFVYAISIIIIILISLLFGYDLAVMFKLI